MDIGKHTAKKGPTNADEPSEAELLQCAATLRRLQPEDLAQKHLSEGLTAVIESGTELFKRQIKQVLFGESDAVEFLKEQSGHRKLLKKLERLQKEIQRENELRCKESASCGINVQREERLAAIEMSCRDGDEPALLSIEAGAASEDSSTPDADKPSAALFAPPPPIGNFRRNCNMCKVPFTTIHHFYHLQCEPCAALNWSKRNQTADMSGMVTIVTGGRVRIGYSIVLKLLRAGAHVVATTRYPADSALRYAAEPDFSEWSERLEIWGPLQLSNIQQVEEFCNEVMRRHPRIHCLINNAAQTLTRAEGWYVRMDSLELKAVDQIEQHSPHVKSLLATAPQMMLGEAADNEASSGPSKHGDHQPDALLRCGEGNADLADFPQGKLDETMQPLDNSKVNSWSRRIGQIPTNELLHTLAANAAAPFVLISRLIAALAPQDEDAQWGHVINVSALEGKFSVGKKGSGHPHTNMAKAALNMLTHTSAHSMFQQRVLINCADTGWVTDMAPGGEGAVAATHKTHVGPPLDEEDGAARVLDPIFSHLLDQEWKLNGKFFKDYHVSPW